MSGARVVAVWFVASSLSACAPAPGTIGAMLGQRGDGRLFIRETPKKLAAHEHGLRPGDEILLIDGMDVRMMDERRLHQALSGDEGSKVKLTVIRGDDVIRVTLARTKPRRRPR